MAKAKDPVCGMTIDEKDAVGTSTYRGTKYFFCSNDCKVEFDENPSAYAIASAPDAGGGGNAEQRM